jgi:hypothetical protein
MSFFERGHRESGLRPRRRHRERDVRDALEEGFIINAHVGRTIRADKAGPIDQKGEIGSHSGAIVGDFVIGPLQKGRINRNNRMEIR